MVGAEESTQMMFHMCKKDVAEAKVLVDRLLEEIENPELRTCFNM